MSAISCIMTIFYVILLTILCKTINCVDVLESRLTQFPNKTMIASRKTRTLPFPTASTVGLLLAVAVPLNLPDQEVFVSYNFEANYNSPADMDIESLGALQKYGVARSEDSKSNHNPKKKNKSTKRKHKVGKSQSKLKSQKVSRKRRLVDRNIVFKVIENKLNSLGFSKVCLLRAICEVASAEYGYNNGILGDIFHIIFTPSASMDDGIDLSYYKAEYKGSSGDCSSYHNKCPKSILDFITVMR